MFRQLKLVRFLPAAVILTLLSACLSVRSLNSADPHQLSHRSWWNYYQRGRLYLKEGRVQLASEDFKTAMGLLPGARYPYNQDRWRARTYGMHMIEGYFPNRELGICLFELNQPQKALELLQSSMQMEPSARARFYINLIRTELTTAGRPPQIDSVSIPHWTNQRAVSLKGSVRSDGYIAQLEINSQPEFIELAEKQLSFERNLPLHEGSNQISITAIDLHGQRTTTNLLIVADWQPPQISLLHVVARATGHEVSLSCQDNFTIDHLLVNGQPRPVANAQCSFSEQIPSGQPLRLSIADRAGNLFDWTLTESEIRNFIQKTQDQIPPRLLLTDAGKTVTLYNDEYALDICAEDDVCLQSIRLNGQTIQTGQSALFRTFRRIPLTPGTNHLVFIAEDTSGKQTEAQITVVRRKPEYLDRFYRLATELSPVSGELPDPTFGHRTDLILGEEITRDPVRFYLLADQKDRKALQQEQSLSAGKLADTRAVLESGKNLPADLIFSTRVLSDGAGQTVYTQVLDAKSREPLCIEDIYVENRQLLAQQLRGLVMKLEQRFPLIQAKVVDDHGKLAINAGNRNGVRNGTQFLVVRSSGPFEQGQVLRSNGQPVELVASGVESEGSLGIITPGSAKHTVQPGDYVFTR